MATSSSEFNTIDILVQDVLVNDTALFDESRASISCSGAVCTSKWPYVLL